MSRSPSFSSPGSTFIRTQTTRAIPRLELRIVATLPEDALKARLELVYDLEVEPMGISCVDLQLKFEPNNSFRFSDVMVLSEDNPDLVLGRTLATIDTRRRTVATLLNLTQQPLTLSQGLVKANCALIET